MLDKSMNRRTLIKGAAAAGVVATALAFVTASLSQRDRALRGGSAAESPNVLVLILDRRMELPGRMRCVPYLDLRRSRTRVEGWRGTQVSGE